MSDRGRGRGPRPEFGSRPLGRTQDFTGRGPLGGRGATGITRTLGHSAPVRTSSGGLSSSVLGGLSSSLAGAAAAAGAAASGRGAGPDHREVRYADGVLAMINILRLLSLGGPRTWDVAAYKQLGMHVAARPGAGVAGREVGLLVNHFAVSIRPAATMSVYQLKAQRISKAVDTAAQQHAAAAAAGEKPLPRALLRRIVDQLADDESWPAGSWVLVGNDRLTVGGSSSSSMLFSTNAAHTAVVHLQEQQQQQVGGSRGLAAAAVAFADGSSSSSGSFKVTLSHIGKHDVNNLRAAAAVDAAGSSVPLLDGIQLLEALLLAAMVQQSSPAAAAATSPRDSISPAAATGALVGSLGSPGSGLMGLAAVASSGGSVPQQGLLSAGIAAAQIGSPTAAAAAAPATAGITSIPAAATGSGNLTIPAGLAAAARIAIGDAVYLHAPGNAEVHASLGRGVEAWLGFKQHVAVTQSGAAAVLDLTAAPFFEPGPLLAAVPVLLGQPAAAAAAAVSENGDVGALTAAETGSAAAAAGIMVSALSNVERFKLENILRGVKVKIILPGKPAKVVSISCLSAAAADQTTFTISSSSSSTALPTGTEVSVATYFRTVYNIQLQAPHLPCIGIARPGSSSSSSSGVGTEQQQQEQQQQQHSCSSDVLWYPLELCRLPVGQRYLSPLDASQLLALARLAAKKSSDRRSWLEAIMAAPAAAAPVAAMGAQPVPVPGAAEIPAAATVTSSGGGSSVNPLSAAGVDVCGVLGVVRGRVLPAPHLAYQNPECCYPGSQGQWNVRACRLPGSSKISSWCLVVLLPQSDVDVEGPSGVLPFMQDLVSSLNSSGIECSMPPIVYEQTNMSVLQHLKAGCEAAQKHFDASADLLLVMLPSRSAALYQEVKLASDAVLGLPSQVLVAAAAGVGSKVQPRGRLQYCSNLGLKINAKMGGVNVRLAGNPDQVIPVIGACPFILFGVALAPPAVNAAAGSPAAAAVVASRDRSLGRYSSRVLLQPWHGHQQQHSSSSSVLSAPAGVVAGLKAAARELLIDFYRQNGGRKPEALLCYRAVSNEGQQQQQTLEFEYQALRAACFELEESYCPPITYVTVNRSHGTRLFPADRDNQDKAGNCLPGTVVDSGICHPTQFDFFLNSHAGLQGHSKPAHYHVLVDENGFSADSLQLFTYWLCFLYCRCSRSVSVVPPAYYAQLAAARGRLLSSGRDQLTVEAEGDAALAAEAADIGLDFDVKVNAKLGGSMYYV